MRQPARQVLGEVGHPLHPGPLLSHAGRHGVEEGLRGRGVGVQAGGRRVTGLAGPLEAYGLFGRVDPVRWLEPQPLEVRAAETEQLLGDGHRAPGLYGTRTGRNRVSMISETFGARGTIFRSTAAWAITSSPFMFSVPSLERFSMSKS